MPSLNMLFRQLKQCHQDYSMERSLLTTSWIVSYTLWHSFLLTLKTVSDFLSASLFRVSYNLWQSDILSDRLWRVSKQSLTMWLLNSLWFVPDSHGCIVIRYLVWSWESPFDSLLLVLRLSPPPNFPIHKLELIKDDIRDRYLTLSLISLVKVSDIASDGLSTFS